MNDKTSYYWIKDQNRFGKREGSQFYLSQDGKQIPDDEFTFLGKLLGYDKSEPDDSPYKMGSTSVLETITVLTEEEFNVMKESSNCQ